MPWIEGDRTQSGLYWYKTGDHDTTVVELSDDGSIVIRENRRSDGLDLKSFRRGLDRAAGSDLSQ